MNLVVSLRRVGYPTDYYVGYDLFRTRCSLASALASACAAGVAVGVNLVRTFDLRRTADRADPPSIWS